MSAAPQVRVSQGTSLAQETENCSLQAKSSLLPVSTWFTINGFHIFRWLQNKSKEYCFMICKNYVKFKFQCPYKHSFIRTQFADCTSAMAASMLQRPRLKIFIT